MRAGGRTAVLLELPVPYIDDDGLQPPGGLVSIASYAAERGFPVSICDLSGLPADQSCARIPAADVYGFSLYSVTYGLALQLVTNLRRLAPEAVLVAGGPHATALPEEVARHFDFVICGEGEQAFTDLLAALSDGHTPRPIIRAEPIAELDQLPFPDFERFCDMKRYTRRVAGQPALCLDSSRGCSFRCRFCNSRVIERGRWRARSPESVAKEVAAHCRRGWTAFRFNDDSFTANGERALAICSLLEPLGIKFRIFARAEDLCNRGICRRLAEAGCVHVSVGIESLSPVMLGRMAKATSAQRIHEGVAAAHQSGLGVRGYFLVGFPGETNDTVAESIAGLDGLELDEATVYPCIPYPGTDLFTRPDHYGITWIDPDFSHFIQVGKNRSAGFVMRTTTFGPEQVQQWRAQFMRALQERETGWCAEKGVAQ